MILHLPDEIISPLNLSEFDLLLELAGLDWVRFRQILADRNIPAHYDEADFQMDLKALEYLV